MDEKQLADVTQRIFGDSGVKVKYTSRQGRHIWTDRDIAAGETVLVSQPYTLIVGEDHLTKVCHACFTVAEPGDKFISCTDCDYAWYCSQDCKKTHRETIHGRECGYLKQLKKKELEIDRGFGRAKMRHLLRLLLQRDAESKWPTDYVPTGPTFPDVAALVSHDAGSSAKEYTQIVTFVKDVLPKEIAPDSVESLVELLVRTDCNQFGLWSANDDLLGVTVHPAASFFNHSCLPNCYCEWRGVNLVFKTLYPVPADNELVISYISGNEPTKKRKKELKRVYHFDCVCSRCVKPEGGSPTYAYDAFFYRFLQCPKCTGILKIDRKKKIAGAEPDEQAEQPPNTENRSCMMCSRRRYNTDIVPSLPAYLKTFNDSELQYVPQKGETVPRKVLPVVDPDDPTPEEKARKKGRKQRRKQKQDRKNNNSAAAKKRSSGSDQDTLSSQVEKMSVS
eukprot:TRINITY_DN13337_c0_g1_i1.p1 TRINITY_DN13337_c0_g1~~TRINITY_DN13337_c0_g1_i1.p1  ORF type:complete len:449 (-),score=74.37 TRINITY_DN13337_c0_g1_i1:76-1422(-)